MLTFRRKYNIEGFPTLIAIKPDGTVVMTQVGYLEGGPKALIEKLDAVIKKYLRKSIFARQIFCRAFFCFKQFFRYFSPNFDEAILALEDGSVFMAFVLARARPRAAKSASTLP